MSETELVVVKTFLNRFEAEIAQGALEAAGIDSMISADDAGGQELGLWVNGITLAVRTEDSGRATAVLNETPEDVGPAEDV